MTTKQLEALPLEDRTDISRGRKNGKVTVELIKKIRETYAAGKRYGDIAEELGLSYVTVRNVVKGLHPLQRDPASPRVDELPVPPEA